MGQTNLFIYLINFNLLVKTMSYKTKYSLTVGLILS